MFVCQAWIICPIRRLAALTSVSRGDVSIPCGPTGPLGQRGIRPRSLFKQALAEGESRVEGLSAWYDLPEAPDAMPLRT